MSRILGRSVVIFLAILASYACFASGIEVRGSKIYVDDAFKGGRFFKIFYPENKDCEVENLDMNFKGGVLEYKLDNPTGVDIKSGKDVVSIKFGAENCKIHISIERAYQPPNCDGDKCG